MSRQVIYSDVHINVVQDVGVVVVDGRPTEVPCWNLVFTDNQRAETLVIPLVERARDRLIQLLRGGDIVIASSDVLGTLGQIETR